MRRWPALTLGVMLLAACHHGGKHEKAENDSQRDTTIPDTGYAVRCDSAQRMDAYSTPRKETVIYSPSQLAGEWQRGNEHELFRADGTGIHWNTNDDVSREEAQPFAWKLENNILETRHTISMGGVVIRQYEVTFVDDETLVYRDRYGDSYMWDKEL